MARAERTADGRTHLVVVRSTRDGVRIVATGVGAAQAESLAPIAARIRRALGVDGRGPLAGTSPFENAVQSLLDAAQASAQARVAIGRLGPRCPAAPSLHAMPEPSDVLRATRPDLVRAAGSIALARRLQALARAFAALAPCPPTHS